MKLSIRIFPAAGLLASTLLLAACAGNTDPAQAAAADNAPAAAAASAAPVAPAALATTGFDITRVPLSTVALGSFPYLQLPDGYLSRRPLEKRFDRIPYWTGDSLEWVEGQVWSTSIHTARDDDYSSLELRANLDAVITAAGGRQLTHARIPREQLDELKAMPGNLLVTYNDGLSDIYNEAVTTWVIRRPDRQIWIHFGSAVYSGGLLITETKPLAVTAALLPADALKQALEQTGKVDIEVNFASDSAQILSASQPQIAQVARLLADDPALALSVNGHTDNSGDAAHNLQLSRTRADSVVAALTATGIDATRLHADGFGDTRPVADNGSEQGKASNRRVELVKR